MRAYLVVVAILAVIFGGLALVLGGRSLSGGERGFQPPPVKVEVAEARVEDRTRYVQAVGSLRARYGVDVTSESSGQVVEINFESGDQVSQGQLLLVLNHKQEDAAYASQRAALDLAQLQYDRDKQLLAKRSISRTQFDQSRSRLDQAKAQLAETEARLANKRIRAAFDGTVGIRDVQLGDYVSPGDKITTLQNLSELELDFSVPAQLVPLIKPGLPVEFRVSAYPGTVFTGEVIALNAKVETSTRNLRVRARVSGETGLLPGMFAEVRVSVGEPVGVVVVPETAISYSLHGNSVYVVENGDSGLHVRDQIVTTGEVRQGRISVLSGLSAGQSVVSAGQNKLYPGAAVAPATDSTSAQPKQAEN